jgi:ribosomal protein S18 acetylase RimI-like enzyme
MQEVQRERLRRDPLGTATTPGDLAWWLLQHPPATATPKRVELFVTPDGEVVAWAVLWLPVTLTYGVRGDDQGVHHEVLDWFAAAAEGGEPLDVALLETDVATRSALESRGFALAEDAGFLHHMAAELATEPRRPALPEGYRLRHVAGERDLPGRVDAHRSAFDPSRVTVESYREVTRTPAYRPELDVVAEAPDGTIAACALAWLDEVSGVGELEPVGTHADHRRRGLATAVCLEALRRLRGLGARTALVYSVDGHASTPLYERVGFRSIGRHVQYRLARGD